VSQIRQVLRTISRRFFNSIARAPWSKSWANSVGCLQTR
jgi:hypothetical protein